MKRAAQITASFFLLLLCSGSVTPQARIGVSQIVTQGTPSDINIKPQVAGPDSCSAVFSSMQDGTPQLVAAAYTNGAFGHLRMLSVDSQTLQVTVLADVSKPHYLLAGAGCRMDLVDLSGTSGSKSLSKVLQIDFPGLSGRGSATWFFEWDGDKFINLGPIKAAHKLPPDSLLYMAYPLDLDHSGPFEIVSLGDGDLQPDPTTGIWNLPTKLVWHFNGTSFVQERTLINVTSFTRSEGEPAPVLTNVTPDTCDQPSCAEFELANPLSSYTLKVINGNADGSHRVSSGHVLLNNVEVVSPSDLSQQVEFVSKPVTLLQKNTLYVSLDSKPHGTIIITIEPPSTQ